jgi:16S rRNA (cytosine1402-N4)-methyltransferase
MVAEIIEVLRPKAGEIVVDCTLGYGGHAGALLKAIQPGGRLIGLDVDPIELPKTVARLGEMGFTEPVFLAVHRNFAGLSQTLADLGIAGADCILADLGVSSMQLDNPERGFTFKHDGPLDLRLNPARGISAADWLTRASVGTLAQALEDYADEPLAQLLARAILHAQSESPIQRTHQLAQMVRSWRVSAAGRVRGAEADLSVRRVFQALRIAVNDEFNALDAFLRNLPFAMAPGGRVAILTFHSGEDRRVKHAFRDGLRSGIYADVSTEVQVAGPEERR